MEILFLGLLYSKEDESVLLQSSKAGLPNACNIFQWNVIKGIEMCINKTVDVCSSLPVGVFPMRNKKIYLHTHRWSHRDGAADIQLGFINFYAIKHWMRKLSFYRQICLWRDSVKNNSGKVLMIYDIYLPILQAVAKIKKKDTSIKACVVVTDLPGALGFDNTATRIKKRIIYSRGKKQLELLKVMDAFVLLTPQMATAVGITGQPFVVVEGLVDETQCLENKFPEVLSGKKIVLYAGSTQRRYGLPELVEVFKRLDDQYTLWICGFGDMDRELEIIQSQHKNIVFFGYCAKSEVNRLQCQATLLINPRKNDGEYTKYSFPSKTLEYLMSGKPVVGYKLAGIPDEYDEYLQYVADNKTESLENKIVEICNLSKDKRDEIGKRGREFVLVNKNPRTQCQKIMTMLGDMTGGTP